VPEQRMTRKRAVQLYEKLKPFLRVDWTEAADPKVRWMGQVPAGNGYFRRLSFMEFLDHYGLEVEI